MVHVENSGSTVSLTALATDVTTVSISATNPSGATLGPFLVTVQRAATTGGGRLGPAQENPTG